jgi:hypothetical protein
MANGLIESCSNRQGAGQNVYYCPAGQKVGTKVVGGIGCGGCAMPAGEGHDTKIALGMIAIGIGVLVSRTTRRSHRVG